MVPGLLRDSLNNILKDFKTILVLTIFSVLVVIDYLFRILHPNSILELKNKNSTYYTLLITKE
jgi:hypothetical protein